MGKRISTWISYSTISSGHKIDVLVSIDCVGGLCNGGSLDSTFYWNPDKPVAQDRNWILLSSIMGDNQVYRLSSLGYVYKFLETYWLEGQRPAL